MDFLDIDVDFLASGVHTLALPRFFEVLDFLEEVVVALDELLLARDEVVEVQDEVVHVDADLLHVVFGVELGRFQVLDQLPLASEFLDHFLQVVLAGFVLFAENQRLQSFG